MTRRHVVGWLALALWMAGAGCGNPFSSSMEEATVKGIVRVRGKPVTNGQISFRALNVNRRNAPTKNAPIGKDGSYKVNALVGENSVTVVCKELFTRQNQNLMDLEDGQMVKIQAGDNTLDIDLPPKPSAPSCPIIRWSPKVAEAPGNGRLVWGIVCEIVTRSSPPTWSTEWLLRTTGSKKCW